MSMSDHVRDNSGSNARDSSDSGSDSLSPDSSSFELANPGLMVICLLLGSTVPGNRDFHLSGDFAQIGLNGREDTEQVSDSDLSGIFTQR
jgi:hypothetical protein